MNLYAMAFRNLWRNPRRTAITMAAITLGLLFTTLYSGLAAGYIADMERAVVEFEVGDLQIFAPGYERKPSIYSAIEGSDALVLRLEAAGFHASARYLAGGLAAAGDNSAGVSLHGVDPARDRTASRLGEQVDRGAFLDGNTPREVVIGKRLARTLGVDVGSEIVVLTQAADGSTANELYRVRGVLKGIADGTDRSAVFMTVPAFRALLVHEGGAHQILVRKPASLTLDEAAARARALAPDLDVKTWKERMPTLATMLQASQSAGAVTSFLVFAAIGIVILNAMLMTVFERVRELGVLKALGMGPETVLLLIVLESLLQAAFATVVGLVLSIPGVYYLARVGLNLASLSGLSLAGIARSSVWRAQFSVACFTGPVAMLFVIVLLAVLYPGIKAARLRPIDAMRHQ